MHIRRLKRKARQFAGRLEDLRAAHPEPGFRWFPYPIMDNIGALDGLLKGGNRKLFEEIRGGVVADLGAADGDLSFFLESLGFTVDLVDTAHANFNGMNGAYWLKKELDSDVAIHDLDLDRFPPLPRESYDLVLLLGTLYHLKNPYGLLEQLAETSRYLLLSTRVTALSAANGVELSETPVAYLLGADELNGDATNFWLFTVEGLHRLVERCGWQIRDHVSFGAVGRSTPQDLDRDERAWLFLESTRVNREKFRT